MEKDDDDDHYNIIEKETSMESSDGQKLTILTHNLMMKIVILNFCSLCEWVSVKIPSL